jgi:hypothetical protein
MDRLPWPKVRDYLIAHQDITLDTFARTYSSSFTVTWPYDPSLAIESKLKLSGQQEATLNPVFEAHLRDLRNWDVTKPFREAWPEITVLIDEYR